MSNKITVILDGRRYHLAADENPGYMNEIAEYVNRQMAKVRNGNSFRSGVECATLTALNLADTLFKERANTEDLRLQLKQALDDVHKAEQRLREYKRSGRSSATATRTKNASRATASQLTLEDTDPTD